MKKSLLRGLASRAKFHKQYRRNGIPKSRIRANTYGAMKLASPLGLQLEHEGKGLKKYWKRHEDFIKIRRYP
jgi:hypothetical protein